MQALNSFRVDRLRRTIDAGSASRWLRWAIAGFLGACVCFFALRTMRWPLVNDPAMISYLCFLMDHGRAPYRDIMALNMPGIFLTNWAVMHALGRGALAWRCFDLLLIGASAVAIIYIARPYDWLAGVFAAALFGLLHGRDGAAQMGQRDFIIAVLLVVSCALLFHALRARKAWPFFFFGLCAAWATTIKPLPLPFVLLLFAVALVRWRKMGGSLGSPLAWGLAGLALPMICVVAFLLHEHALGAFYAVVRYTLPYYAGLGRQSFDFLFMRFKIHSLTWLLALALAAALASRHERNWEYWVIVGGMAFGCFSYFAQGKGFYYHRYPFIAFAALWIALELFAAARERGPARLLGCAGILFGLVVAPLYIATGLRYPWPMNYIDNLQSNLAELGGSHLSGHIQCLAMPANCDTVLYRMRLVQSTSLTYDYFIFGHPNQPVVQNARAEFWRQIVQNPPKVFVVSKGLYPENMNDYRKLSEWPRFASYLRSGYVLWRGRDFPDSPWGPSGFRIYLRRKGFLVADASAAQAKNR